jgi:hypothetical protein
MALEPGHQAWGRVLQRPCFDCAADWQSMQVMMLAFQVSRIAQVRFAKVVVRRAGGSTG